MGPVIETRRLQLTPAGAADVDALHAVWTDPDVRRYLWDDIVISRERAREAVEDSVNTFAARRMGLWLAHARNDGQMIGFAGLRPFEDDVEVIYGVRPASWRQGYARELAMAMFRYGFEQCGLSRILGQADSPNVGSIGVMQSLGMRRLPDVTRDGHPHTRFVIDASEFVRARLDSRA